MSASGGSVLGAAGSVALESADGALVAVAPGQWAVTNGAAVGAQSTISRAAVAAVRHCCTGIAFCLSATTALAAISTATVNLRDGATGAGTVLWSWQVTLPAATLLPLFVQLAGLELVGSVNTAMTLEFAAGIGNLMTSVSLAGFDA